jgi:Ca2+-binding RTX toxin-like protein
MLSSRRWFCSAVLALACGGGVVEAGTITVGNGGITTIQQAIDAALANADTSDTINIPSGIYAESVYISLTGTPTQASLALQRSGKGLVQIVGTSADKNAVRIQDAHGITLKNLTVQSFSADGDEPAVEIGGVTSNVVLDGVSASPGTTSASSFREPRRPACC